MKNHEARLVVASCGAQLAVLSNLRNLLNIDRPISGRACHARNNACGHF